MLLAVNLLISHSSASKENHKGILGGPKSSRGESILTKDENVSELKANLNRDSDSAAYITDPSKALTKEGEIINPIIISLAAFKGMSQKNEFSLPTTGWNWGIIHDNNAVDIANDCGTPVYAAKEGLIKESAERGLNDGYGKYVKIEHPQNKETLYAHLEKISVSLGKYVSQGDLIGYMGSSGNTDGPTGCHLHFEVRGAKNPLAK